FILGDFSIERSSRGFSELSYLIPPLLIEFASAAAFLFLREIIQGLPCSSGHSHGCRNAASSLVGVMACRSVTPRWIGILAMRKSILQVVKIETQPVQVV